MHPFEKKMRDNIIQSSLLLLQSQAAFATFVNHKGNPVYWQLTPQGGFQLYGGRRPSDAIRDIYVNGRLYAFECSTAMVIVLYYAVLESLGESIFNQLFTNLYVRDWHFDADLGLSTSRTTSFIPGDILYFRNPDVNPHHPEWQGENVVDLGNGQYYGHGMGIKDAYGVISTLNGLRKPDATRSAFLEEQATTPNFSYLSQFAGYASFSVRSAIDILREQHTSSGHVLARVADSWYIS